MVKGLEKFRDTFKYFHDQYVMIGGTACDLAMEEAGIVFRATKDLDIELFSRKPDILTLNDGAHLTPIPINEEVLSLSAILLADDYYNFLHVGKQIINDISILRPEHLIPLKARQAWIDLTEHRKQGGSVDRNAIRKYLWRQNIIVITFRQVLSLSVPTEMTHLMNKHFNPCLFTVFILDCN